MAGGQAAPPTALPSGGTQPGKVWVCELAANEGRQILVRGIVVGVARRPDVEAVDHILVDDGSGTVLVRVKLGLEYAAGLIAEAVEVEGVARLEGGFATKNKTLLATRVTKMVSEAAR